MPALVIIEIMYYSIFWLHSFPPSDGVSAAISPRGLVTGLPIDYAQHCKLAFGTYVQTHEAHDNSMATCTTGAIAMHPTGNAQGATISLAYPPDESSTAAGGPRCQCLLR